MELALLYTYCEANRLPINGLVELNIYRLGILF